MKQAAIAAFLCLAVIPGLAASSDQQHASQLWLGLSVMDFQYKEYSDQGDLLDREDGPIPGLRMGLNFQQGDLLFNIDATTHAGTVDYDGQTQNGTPHKTLTHESIRELTASLGRRLGETGVLYVGAGYRQWDRDIQPSGGVSGLFERYTWPYAMLGGELRVWGSAKHRLALNGRITYPINPEMLIRLTGIGDVSLSLGAQAGFRLTAPWLIRLDSGQQLQIAPYYAYWRMGRSPDVRAGGYIIFEPRSETDNLGLTVSLGF